MAATRCDSGRRCDVVEVPVAKIAIERVGAFGAREKHVGSAVAVDIGETDAGALSELAILHQLGVAHRIRERNAGMRELCEAGRESSRRRKLAPAIP